MIARQKSPNPCGPAGPDTRQTYTAISKGRRQPPLGDHLPLCWSDDGYIYIASCDSPSPVSRNVGIFRLGNPAQGISSHTPVRNAPIPNVHIGNDLQWGGFAQQGMDSATWKACGFISVNNKLYLSLTRLVYPANPVIKTGNLQIFISADHGGSWTPAPQAQGEAMYFPQFPNELNNCVSFFIYGQNNTAAVHRADEFVYGFSNWSPIPWIQGQYRVLGRCPIAHMDDYGTSAHWRYYQGGDGLLDSSWSSDGSLSSWYSATPIMDFRDRIAANIQKPREPWPTQPTWFPHYKGGRYIWIAGEPAAGLSPIDGAPMPWWEFWESPYPWGPWVSVSQYTLDERAALVTSGNIAGYARVGSFPQIITSSVQDTNSSATAVICCNGWYVTTANPPATNDYMLHLLAMKLSAGTPITAGLVPPGLELGIATTFPVGIVGTAYSVTLAASGGTAPYHWTSSSLPAGLSLDESAGVISGIPTTAITTDVTLTVTDVNSATASLPLRMSIQSVGVPVSIVQTKVVIGTGFVPSVTATFDNPVTPGNTVFIIFLTVGGTPTYPVTHLKDNLDRAITPLFVQWFASGVPGANYSSMGMAASFSAPSEFQSVSAIFDIEAFYPSIRIIEFAGSILGFEPSSVRLAGGNHILGTWQPDDPVPVVNNSLLIAFGFNNQQGITTIAPAPPWQPIVPGAISALEDFGSYLISPPTSPIQAQFTVVTPSPLPDRPGGLGSALALRIAVI